MNAREQAREAGGKWLYEEQGRVDAIEWEDQEEQRRSLWRREFDRLLKEVKGPGWHLGIIDENARLPENPYPATVPSAAWGFIESNTDNVIYRKAQQDMLDANWVREIR